MPEPSTDLAVAAKTELALPGEQHADEAAVAEVVAEINHLWTSGRVLAARRIGELILERFFDADIAKARSRKAKHATFQAIVTHEQLAMGASGLWYCVSVYENFGLMAENVAEALSVGHHRLLAHIDDRAKRAALADAAVAQGLSVRGLKAAIAAEKAPPKPGAPRRGRPAFSPITKGLNAATTAVATLTGVDPTVAGELTAEARVQAARDARALADRLRSWADSLADDASTTSEA